MNSEKVKLRSWLLRQNLKSQRNTKETGKLTSTQRRLCTRQNKRKHCYKWKPREIADKAPRSPLQLAIRAPRAQSFQNSTIASIYVAVNLNLKRKTRLNRKPCEV